MPHSRHNYEEHHESAESLRDDRDVHPFLRRFPRVRRWPCRACGVRLDPDGLTDDELCPECDRAVKDLEGGKI